MTKKLKKYYLRTDLLFDLLGGGEIHAVDGGHAIEVRRGRRRERTRGRMIAGSLIYIFF